MTPFFYFDFGSPNAYLAHRVLPQVEERIGLRFQYVPVLLGGLFKLTNNQAPSIAFAGIPAKLAYEHREIERFIARHGLTRFRLNPYFPVNTLMLMRGAVAAEMQGVFVPYVEAMFRGMWEDGLKLDDPAVLAAALGDAGLPAEALMAGIQDQAVKDRLMANTQAAFEHGAFGIPSFVVGGELFFGKNSLPDVEREVLAQRATAPA